MYGTFQFSKDEDSKIPLRGLGEAIFSLDEKVSKNADFNYDFLNGNYNKSIDISHLGTINWGLHEIKNAFLIIHPGLDGIVLTENLGIVESQFKFHRKNELSYLVHDIFSQKVKITNIAKAVVCLDPGWNNYYHFLISVLPKLAFVNKYFKDISEYVVWPDHANFKQAGSQTPALSETRINEICGLFNLERRNQSLLKHGVYRVKQLFVPTTNLKRLMHKVYSPFLLSTFRGVSDSVDVYKKFENRDIFISRKKSNNKRPLDFLEDELYQKNHKKAIRVVLDEFSFKDQVGIFKSVKTVSGIHGAAFTNLLFSQGNIKEVKEYASKTKKGLDPRPHFYHIAKAKNIPYSGEYLML